MKQHKQFFQRLGAAAFWLAVWQCAAMAVGQEVFLVSPVQAVRTLLQLLPQAEFWQRVGFSSGRILLGFGLGVAVSIVLAVAAQAWHTADVYTSPGTCQGIHRTKGMHGQDQRSDLAPLSASVE